MYMYVLRSLQLNTPPQQLPEHEQRTRRRLTALLRCNGNVLAYQPEEETAKVQKSNIRRQNIVSRRWPMRHPPPPVKNYLANCGAIGNRPPTRLHPARSRVQIEGKRGARVCVVTATLSMLRRPIRGLINGLRLQNAANSAVLETRRRR